MRAVDEHSQVVAATNTEVRIMVPTNHRTPGTPPPHVLREISIYGVPLGPPLVAGSRESTVARDML
jgi:hypothetical protein